MQTMFDSAQVPSLRTSFKPFKVIISTKRHCELKRSESSMIYQNKKTASILADFYFFDNPEEIEDFLFANNRLVDALFGAVSHIDNIFGDVIKRLEFYRDADEGWAKLFMTIQSPYGTNENFRRQKQLVHEWLIKADEEVVRRLTVETEPLESQPHDVLSPTPIS